MMLVSHISNVYTLTLPDSYTLKLLNICIT